MKYVSILGSTGSVGTNSLSVISSLSKKFSIYGLSCNKNILLLEKQIISHSPKFAVITNKKSYDNFIKKNGDTFHGTNIIYGEDGLESISSNNKVSTVIVAIVGFSCIKPVISAIKHNKIILTANKEILVSAGDVIISTLNKTNATLLPIDSEHNALLQVLLASGLEYKINNKEYYKNKIKKLILTASGGPFYDYSQKDLENVSPTQALQHPTWNMGKKISVDSATMMNKGLEIIEAKVLFNLELDNITAIIHRQSKVHALVEFFDGTVIAHMSNPDMKIPISFALTYPERIYEHSNSQHDYADLSFEKLSLEQFPCYRLSRNVAKLGKNSGLILNAANEISVEYFLKKKILYTDIPRIIEDVMDASEIISHDNINCILENDLEIREKTRELIKTKYL